MMDRTEFWVWLWWWSRSRALSRLQIDHTAALEDAHIAWREDAVLTRALATAAWNTGGLADDLALHDAADSLLGRYV